MNTFIEGRLTNVFKNADFTDKTSGEVTAGKYQLQFMHKRDMGEGLGEQLVLEKISIPEDIADQYKDKVGQVVKVAVKAMVTNGSKNSKVIFYGISA